MTPEEYAEAGLYDAAEPSAAERLALLDYLHDQGCTLDEMAAAHARGRLFALAGDRIVRPGRDRYTLDEVAEQLHAAPDDVREMWRSLGLVEPSTETPVAPDDDVEALRSALDVVAVLGFPAARGIARVVAASLSRIADATSTAAQASLPGLNTVTSGSELATAQVFGALAEFIPRMGRLLDVVYRHHLEAARMHFESTEGWAGTDDGLHLAVGFADLSGFTGLTENLALAALSELLTNFETIGAGVVRERGGRVVKFIGDAVMYVAGDHLAAAEIGCALVGAASDRGLQARAGVASGQVLAFEGDYFGPVVNLASRLAGLAEPGHLLVTAEVAASLDDQSRVSPRGEHPVRGFTRPVEIFDVVGPRVAGILPD